jgi:hypothetical protein
MVVQCTDCSIQWWYNGVLQQQKVSTFNIFIIVTGRQVLQYTRISTIEEPSVTFLDRDIYTFADLCKTFGAIQRASRETPSCCNHRKIQDGVSNCYTNPCSLSTLRSETAIWQVLEGKVTVLRDMDKSGHPEN